MLAFLMGSNILVHMMSFWTPRFLASCGLFGSYLLAAVKAAVAKFVIKLPPIKFKIKQNQQFLEKVKFIKFIYFNANLCVIGRRQPSDEATKTKNSN